MSLERVLITVKTYPNLSQRYIETVCTAGLREDGSWVRIYPVPFRQLSDLEKYRKFDWFECDLVSNAQKDPRPESRRLADTSSLRVIGHIDTSDKWRERRARVLERGTVYTDFQPLIEGAKQNRLSLATFKPAKILDLDVCEDDRNWEPSKLEAIQGLISQPDLFDNNAWRTTFKVVNKLPYQFYYRFLDASGIEHKLKILDWEIGRLFWRYPDEKEALIKIRHKYLDEFNKTDLHFFLGTTLRWHSVAPNPWMIIGVAPFPLIDPEAPRQLSLPI